MAMKFLDLERTPLNLADYTSRTARDEDVEITVKESCIVRVGGNPVVVYLSRVDELFIGTVRNIVQTIKYQKSTRTGGLVTNSKIFGYAPRNYVRNAPCRISSMQQEQPAHHAALMSFAEVVAKHYERHLPDQYEEHKRKTESRILKRYRMGGTPFTSGIVNKNNPLKYHFDSGNFKGNMSAMLAIRHGTTGGNLCVPELGARFEITDGSLIIFDGQGLLHGVTPINLKGSDSYRYTIVYYSLEQLWRCEEPQVEISKMRQSRTETEFKKAKK